MNVTHVAFIVYMFPWFVSLILWLLFDNTFTMLHFHRLNDFAGNLFFEVTHYTFYIPCKLLDIPPLKEMNFFGGPLVKHQYDVEGNLQKYVLYRADSPKYTGDWVKET